MMRAGTTDETYMHIAPVSHLSSYRCNDTNQNSICCAKVLDDGDLLDARNDTELKKLKKVCGRLQQMYWHHSYMDRSKSTHAFFPGEFHAFSLCERPSC